MVSQSGLLAGSEVFFSAFPLVNTKPF